MNRIALKNALHTLFCVGIVCLPGVELYRSFFGDTLQVLGFALEELLLILWAAALFLGGCFVAFKEGKKRALVATGIWLGIALIYLLLHSWNTAHFDRSLLPGAEPGFFAEAYYVGRMYLAPTSLLISAYLLELPRRRLFSALRASLWILSLGIVIPGVLGISFSSYLEGNETVAGGFFSWFFRPEGADPAAYTARGFFPRANVVGAALFGLTPLAAHSAMERFRVRDLLLLLFTGLASVMVGTKIASLGFFLGLGASLVITVIRRIWCKNGQLSWHRPAAALLILLVIFPLFLASPGRMLQENRREQKETEQRPLEQSPEVEELLEEVEENHAEVITSEETLVIQDYLKEHYWDHFIDPWFLELYPPENDPAFWCLVAERDNRENQDSRRFKLELCQRIMEQNGRGTDVLFGLGYTSGIPYAERDYAFQFYELGILGLIVLIAPFFALFLWGIFFLFRSLWHKKDFAPIGAICLSLFCFFVTAYLAGHVFDTALPTYLVSLTSAGLAAGGTHEG